jgi:predicted HD superfamily hydrolase involved in NAD metabolism
MPQPELAQIAEHYQLVDTENTLMIGAVLHGPVGAWLAKKDFNVTDEEVLSAIRSHTTGRENMTLFEMAVFVADAIEEGREDYPGLQKIRWLSEKSLPCAVLCSIEGTKHYIQQSDSRGLDASTLKTEAYLRSILTEQEKQWMCASIP